MIFFLVWLAVLPRLAKMMMPRTRKKTRSISSLAEALHSNNNNCLILKSVAAQSSIEVAGVFIAVGAEQDIH